MGDAGKDLFPRAHGRRWQRSPPESAWAPRVKIPSRERMGDAGKDLFPRAHGRRWQRSPPERAWAPRAKKSGEERLSRIFGYLPPMRRLHFSILSIVVLLAPSAPAAALDLELPEVRTWNLENGLQVAYLRVKHSPAVTVQVWYRAGSKDEAPDRRGSAHMFEHMMFKGTERVRPEAHARLLNRLGGTVNAFTTEDVTAYHNTLPAQYMAFAVELEAERMRSLLFRPEMIASEKEVVKEEIRQQENSPLYKGFLQFLQKAYQVHPYAWTAGGDLGDLENTSTDDLKRFYRSYYTPDNALLVVVGDVPEDEVRRAAAAHFADLPRGGGAPRPAAAKAEPEQSDVRRATAEPSQIGLVIAGYHVPAAADDDIYPLQVAALILSGGESSRLYERLVRREKIARQAGGQLMVREHPGLFLLFGVFLEPGAAAKIERSLLAEIERLQKQRASARELAKAKNQLTSNFVYGLQSVEGLASQMGTSWVHTGDPSSFLSELDKFQKVGAADVQRVARRYLDPKKMTVVVIPPMGARR